MLLCVLAVCGEGWGALAGKSGGWGGWVDGGSVVDGGWDCAFAQELDQWLTLSVSRCPGESGLEHDVVVGWFKRLFRIFVERIERAKDSEGW